MISCSTCKTLKPIDCFHRNKASKTGRQNECIACRKMKARRKLLSAYPSLERVNDEFFRLGKLRCNRCGFVKPVEKFFMDKKTKHGKAHSCRACMRKKDYPSNREINELLKDFGKHRCIRCGKIQPLSEQDLSIKRCCKFCSSIKRAAYNFKISEEDAELLLNTTICAICCRQINGKAKHIDHDHTTGKIRSVLCSTCNQGLGMFRDDIDIMTRAIKYLKDHHA